ncbi:MAG TPA: phosphate signaling complex protein PhoU [Candidatus Limiplasma stercoravium]|nr:phosphate signaling complex protein PhoU [Candidatus Limiplasma stercoravium]
MPRRSFDEKLEELTQEMTQMGAMIENAIEMALRALTCNDVRLAQEVMRGDAEVDHKERGIETLCLRLLLTQQPLARDLRKVSSALKMIGDMERVGDQAADICEIVTVMGGEPGRGPSQLLSDMARHTADMVHRAIDAYVAGDVHLAREVMAFDDVVDDLFARVKDELIALLSAEPSQGQLALDLLMIAKYFERIGDHAVNISEWVEFSVTGLYKGESLP